MKLFFTASQANAVIPIESIICQRILRKTVNFKALPLSLFPNNKCLFLNNIVT